MKKKAEMEAKQAERDKKNIALQFEENQNISIQEENFDIDED